MLSRAALPLLRPRVALALPTRTVLASPPHLRYFTNNSRLLQSDGFKPPSSSPFSNSPSDRSQKNNVTPNTNSTSQPPKNEFSETQPEFESSADPEKNTASQSGSPKDEPESEPLHRKPQQPLPDLTQGIPSTIAAEIEARSKGRGPTGLNLTEDPERSDDTGDEGGIPKNAYVSSSDRRRNRIMKFTYGLLFFTGVGATVYSGRDWDTEEEEKKHPNAPSGWGFGLFFDRIKARYSDITSYYKDPAFEKLLPDEDPQLRQPYTLVISLEDLLVHSEWTREHGYRVAKRPGVDYFLRYLNQYYELVLFTSVPSMAADQVLRKLDPYRIIRWVLFREATKYEDGEYVKDLSYLNRDLSKVILVDTHGPHAKRQPENAIILDKWKGKPGDKDLVALIPFLEYIAGMGIEDVRPVLKSFEGKNIPVEFAKREKAMREKFEKQLAEERAKKPKYSVSGLTSLLGVKPTGPVIDGIDPSGLEQGKMLWDQIRERGQMHYQMIDKEIRENGDKWLAEMAAEEKKAMDEQMKGMKGSVTGWFGIGQGQGDEQSKK
ncbi:mitochondrial inner membrane protein required for protein import [Emmonsiellopsis sp. PD_5]|nr:mitochondrial inner membrane protein required for protein import [Emmonsiellopsis sp. PD_5]